MKPTLALVVLALAACTPADNAEPGPSTPTGPPIIVPNTPGGTNQTVPTMPAVSETMNAADVTFLRDMMVHHTQAVRMADWARTRAGDDTVKRLAERIRVGQKPEIDAMGQMLKQRGHTPPDLTHADHTDHSGMPGMATPAQLAALQRRTGTGFDQEFLRLMIKHHQGAVTMSSAQIGRGSDPLVEQTAADIRVTQTKEIATMRRMLAG